MRTPCCKPRRCAASRRCGSSCVASTGWAGRRPCRRWRKATSSSRGRDDQVRRLEASRSQWEGCQVSSSKNAHLVWTRPGWTRRPVAAASGAAGRVRSVAGGVWPRRAGGRQTVRGWGRTGWRWWGRRGYCSRGLRETGRAGRGRRRGSRLGQEMMRGRAEEGERELKSV